MNIFDFFFFFTEVEAKNSEVLINTQTTISCVVNGLTKALNEVAWRKPNSFGLLDHGVDGYEIDIGTFDTESRSQTTVLTIPADENTADSVFTCIITSAEHAKVADETYVDAHIFGKSFKILYVRQNFVRRTRFLAGI